MAAPFHNPWLLAAYLSRDFEARLDSPASEQLVERPGGTTDRRLDPHLEPSPRRRWGGLAFVGACAAGFLFAAGGVAYGVFRLFT